MVYKNDWLTKCPFFLIKLAIVSNTSAPHFTLQLCDSITALLPYTVHLLGHLAGNWIGISMCCNTRWGPSSRFSLELQLCKNTKEKLFSLYRHQTSCVEIKLSLAILQHFNIKDELVRSALVIFKCCIRQLVSLQRQPENVGSGETEKRSTLFNSCIFKVFKYPI